MKLWLKIIIALALGIATGGLLGEKALVLKPLGDIFLNLIHMVIPLLILSSITAGITSIHDPEKLGRVGMKTLIVYFVTTFIGVIIGIGFAMLLLPSGGGEDLLGNFAGGSFLQQQAVGTPKTPSLSAILVSVVPKNPIDALATENVLQIIVFALFLGIAINFAGEKGRPVREFLDSLADVMYRLTSLVMEFSPVGVFALTAIVSGTFGWKVWINLGAFVMAYYAAGLFHCVVVFCGMLAFMAKLNPWRFFVGMGDAIMVAFSTASSSATLPTTLHCGQKNLGISKNIASFVLPLGSSINMNGTAIFLGMSAIFVAGVYDITLDWNQVMMIVVTSILSAIGAASIPSAGIFMLGAVLSSVGLPFEGAFLLYGIDRIREMGSTVLNILGDAVAAVYIAKQEGELDERQYNHEDLIELEESDA